MNVEQSLSIDNLGRFSVREATLRELGPSDLELVGGSLKATEVITIAGRIAVQSSGACADALEYTWITLSI